MAINAKLINDVRTAERFPVELDATVRNAAELPSDVVIEDLSATGFRMVGGPHMEIGSAVSIGFAGIGVRSARLVRHDEGSYACELHQPLSASELSTALNATPVEPIMFPKTPSKTWLADAPEPYVEGYSPKTKLALAIVMPATLWAVIAGIYWAS
jgi:hypothetical protein